MKNYYCYGFDRKSIPVSGINKILSIIPMILALCGFALGWVSPEVSGDVVSAGVLGFGGLAMGGVIREEFNDNNGGGGSALGEKEFQGKVLGAIEKQQLTTDDLVAKFDNLDKETKQTFEDITKQKNEFEGTSSQVNQLTHSIKMLQLQLKNEQRAANGDPVRRMLADADNRLLLNAKIRRACGKSLTEAQQKAITSGSTPGSTYINDSLDTEIYDTLASYGIWNTFDVKTVSTRNNKFLVKTARPVASFFGEGVTITEDSTKAGASVTCEAKGIKVILSVPNELLDDSEVDVSADIMNDFLEAISYRMDWACLQANGGADAVDGGFNGIFDGGTASVAAAGNVSVETLDFEDVTKAMLSVDEGVLGRESRWWMHPRQLIRMLSIKDSNGRPIFLTAVEAPTPAGIGSILGSAVVPSFAAPTANTTSSDIAVFGDPKGLVVGLRKGIEFAESTDSKFEDYETTFRGVGRFGAKIRDAGAFAVLTTAAS